MPAQSYRPVLPPWAKRLLLRASPPWEALSIAVGCVAIAAIVRTLLTPLVSDRVPFITFFPAVLIASVAGGPMAGVSALLLASLIAGYVWLDPPMSFMLSPSSVAITAIFWLLCGLLIVIAELLRALVRALAQSEERANILAHEMTHRVRNVLGLVQAISRQTLRSAPAPSDFHKLFEGRLIALSRAQELVTDNPDLPTDLSLLLARVLEPFGGPRFTLSGPPGGVPGEVASMNALLIHELGTNSLKYGALSVPAAAIAVDWTSSGNQVQIDWREMNGPPAARPSRAGFGSRLMKTAFPPGRGEVSVAYEPEGVWCRVRIVGFTV